MATATKNINRVKAEARSKWDRLTDEDFDSIKNNVVELATRLQARYGFTAEQAKKEAEEFMENVGEIASDAYDQAKDVAQAGYGHARDAYHAAADALDEAATRVDRVVKDNAWATVAGAVLLGGIIGYLVGYESRPRSRWY